MSTAERTRQYYDEYENYETQLVHGYGWRVPRIVAERHMEHASPHKQANILDVGCGTGLAGVHLRRRGFKGRLSGVDFARRRLREAAERTVRNAKVYDLTRKADARHLPWRSPLFDGVVSSAMLGLCGREAFDEMVRVLRPGYRMTVAVGKIMHERQSIQYFDSVTRRISFLIKKRKLCIVHREDLGSGYTSTKRDGDERYTLYILQKAESK